MTRPQNLLLEIAALHGSGRTLLASGLAALLLVLTGGGCSEPAAGASGEPSATSENKEYELDVDDVAEGDWDEVALALEMPHAEASERIGAHRAVWEVKHAIYAAGKLLTAFEETMTLETDEAGSFHLVHVNDKKFAKNLYWVEGELYVKGRWGPLVHRRPTRDEVEHWRNDVWRTGAVFHRLLGGALRYSEDGEESVAGRNAYKVTVGVDPEGAAEPGAAADFNEDAPAKAWRKTIRLESATGHYWFDADTGVPLKADLVFKYTAVKDGREAKWSITVALVVDQIGTAGRVAPPAEYVESPARLRPIIDRERVLGEKRVDLALMTDEELWALARSYDLDVHPSIDRPGLIKALRSHDPSLSESVLVDDKGPKADSPVRTDIDLGATMASEEIPMEDIEGDDDDDADDSDDDDSDDDSHDDDDDDEPAPDDTGDAPAPKPAPAPPPTGDGDEGGGGERDDF